MYSENELIKINKSLRSQDDLVFWTRVLTIITETILRTTSLKTTEKLLSAFKKNTSKPNQTETTVIIDRYFITMGRINQQPYLKGRCLSQSLVMRLLLNRKGVIADLKIGMKQSNGKFDAHAWLEMDGKPINDHISVTENYLIILQEKRNSVLEIV